MSIVLKEFDWDRDVVPIDKIYQKQKELTGVPSLNSVLANKSIIDNETGELIGYGVVKLFAEGVLILDKSIPKRKRAEAVKLALNESIAQARNAGLEYLYVFSSIPSYTKVLRKKYNFKEYTGRSLLAFDLREEN